MEPFDPWDTVTTRLATKVPVGTRTVSQSLHNRATQRLADVVRMSGRGFVVVGNDKFNDTYPQYDVTWKGGDEYECSCWSLTHGDSRARKLCSHVVAVMLYREQHGNPSGSNSRGVSDGGDERHIVETLPFDEDDNDSGVRAIVRSQARTDLTIIPSITDPMFTNWDIVPLPSKFQELRPHQWDAVNEAMEHYARGVQCVMVDGPTGTGKTVIAELIRRLLKSRAFYICHSLSLQSQFAADFPYARVLKGRSNYPTLDGGPEVTCADCTSNGPEDSCMWCDEKDSCPYQVAKSQALQSKLAVLNTAYFLTEFNYVGNVGKGRELGIIDEVDVLESALMSFAEFYLGERMLNKIGVTAPGQGSHYSTLGKWLVEEFKPRLSEYQRTIRGDDLRAIREKMTCARLMGDVLRIEGQVGRDETLGNWVRDNKAGPFVLKPVTVGEYGGRYVWGYANRWLLMSATIISAEELATSCGLVGEEGKPDRTFEVVKVPMTFPVENRRVIVAPVADMSKKGKDAGEWEYAVTALRNICNNHAGERVLVHTVSYELARFVMDRLAHTLDRPVYSYGQASSRDLTLAKFRRDVGAVLVAPSMDRGVDLVDDECRVIVVLKLPFGYLGDPQVGKRLKSPGGQQWYNVACVRHLVQMTGRAVRHERDSCTTYILDRQFVSNLWKKNKGLFPKWWSEALVWNADIRGLLKNGE